MQWKLLSRSVIEKLVSSQEFWDILFSCRSTLVPDEHALINAIKRIMPQEPFIYHNIHYKNWSARPVDEEMVKKAMDGDSWFIRKLVNPEQFDMVKRMREERFNKPMDSA